jgi:hypothetical protein
MNHRNPVVFLVPDWGMKYRTPVAAFLVPDWGMKHRTPVAVFLVPD